MASLNALFPRNTCQEDVDFIIRFSSKTNFILIFMHLFFAKVTSEEVNLFIVKGRLDVKHVDIVASLK